MTNVINFKSNQTENKNICEHCQDKTNLIGDFLNEFKSLTEDPEGFDIDIFIEMLEDLYDDSYDNGKREVASNISDYTDSILFGED